MVTMAGKTALLVRVGVDSTDAGGGWNAPVDADTLEFVYVPIPEREDRGNKPIRPGYQKSYRPFKEACERFECPFPDRLLKKNAHLDPDFEHLTYGDEKRKGDQIRRLVEDDVVAFYVGLRPTSGGNRLLYGIIGLYVVEGVEAASKVSEADWHKNAHTRRKPDDTDYVVFAKRGLSGRLGRCIPIGEWRDKAYRVTKDLLDRWGDLTAHDGYIQRSGRIPSMNDADRFEEWLKEQRVSIVQRNN